MTLTRCRHTPPCGCPDSAVITDAARHEQWHRQIAPLTRADAATLEAAYGRPSTPTRTFVDEQFDAERAKQAARQQLAAAGAR